MTASANVTLSAANVRASCARLPCRATAAVWAIRFHAAQIGGFQNSPICVWSGVRVEPCAAPRAWTSWIAAAYFALVSGAGGGGRNASAPASANGRTCAQCVNTGAAKAGGVSW